MDPSADRGRVAVIALGCLETSGFAVTGLADIARAAKVTEAELRGLFGDMEGLMGELVAPLLGALSEVVASAAVADLGQPGRLRAVFEGYFDALMAHRRLVGVIVGDPAGAASEAVRLVRSAMARVRDTLAGGEASGLDRRIRVASALGAVQAAVVDFSEIDQPTVRAVVADAAVAILLS